MTYKDLELNPISNKLTELKALTSNTIDKVLIRGEKIDKLVDDTHNLENSSQLFLKNTKKLKNKLFYKKIRCICIIILFIVLFIYFICALICANLSLNPC